MGEFSWLLISDLHLRSNYTTWSQSVVLRDMVRDIQTQQSEFPPIRFVIVSGDLAHGGKSDQYPLVEAFLDELLTALQLNRTDVYIVPGNHDVDRDIHQLAFHGARATFVNAEKVEHFLSNSHERKLLLKRLAAYYVFEQRVCPHLANAYTDDRLAYFATRLIGDLPIGIVGLNSALACGNDEDNGRIVIGDRPLIDICEKMRGADVRLMVALVHHPPLWLAEFDQKTFASRLLPLCDILHRGHLHEPDMKPISTSPHTNCLVISAGASYEYRQFKNSYSFVSCDIPNANCTVVNFAYDSHSGRFSQAANQSYPIRLRGEIPGNSAELASAISSLGEVTASVAPYLAALIERKVTELPLPINGFICFGALELLKEVDDPTYASSALAFSSVRNSLLAFPNSAPVEIRVAANAEPIVRFAIQLRTLTQKDAMFTAELHCRVSQAAKLCSINAEPQASTFVRALDQLAVEEDWSGLESVARRYSLLESREVTKIARARLALALAHSDDLLKQSEARDVVESLVADRDATSADFELAFAINRSQKQDARAERLLMQAMETFTSLPLSLIRSGYRFAAESGNIVLKTQLDKLAGDGNE